MAKPFRRSRARTEQSAERPCILHEMMELTETFRDHIKNAQLQREFIVSAAPMHAVVAAYLNRLETERAAWPEWTWVIKVHSNANPFERRTAEAYLYQRERLVLANVLISCAVDVRREDVCRPHLPTANDSLPKIVLDHFEAQARKKSRTIDPFMRFARIEMPIDFHCRAMDYYTKDCAAADISVPIQRLYRLVAHAVPKSLSASAILYSVNYHTPFAAMMFEAIQTASENDIAYCCCEYTDQTAAGKRIKDRAVFLFLHSSAR